MRYDHDFGEIEVTQCTRCNPVGIEREGSYRDINPRAMDLAVQALEDFMKRKVLCKDQKTSKK